MNAPAHQPFDTSDPAALAARSDNQLAQPAAARPQAGSVMLHPGPFALEPDGPDATDEHPADGFVKPSAQPDPDEPAEPAPFLMIQGAIVAPAADPGREFLVLAGGPHRPIVVAQERAKDGIGFRGPKRRFRPADLTLVCAAPELDLPRSGLTELLGLSFGQISLRRSHGGCDCRRPEPAEPIDETPAG